MRGNGNVFIIPKQSAHFSKVSKITFFPALIRQHKKIKQRFFLDDF